MIASYLRCFTSRLLLCQDVSLLGAHRYTPYIVPPVMGPLGPNCLPTPAVVSSASAGAATAAAAAANQLILNQPLVMKNHQQQQASAPNAVVNSTGTAVPVKQQHKTVSRTTQFVCVWVCVRVREYEYERRGQLCEVSSVVPSKPIVR